MIISKAPLRVSYAGGGTDLEAYYSMHEGLVLSAAVSLYTHVMIEPLVESCEVVSDDYGERCRCSHPADIPDETPFRLARAALAEIGVPPNWSGIRVTTASDVVPGTGLGASCSMVVSLCCALLAARGLNAQPVELAELAYRVDTVRAGMSSGKQDHYAAAFGGLNVFTFRKDGVLAESFPLHATATRELEAWTMVFYDGRQRDAQGILRQQSALTQSTGATLDALHDIKGLALEMIKAVRVGDLPTVGALMDSSWQAKQRVSDAIGSPHIATAYARAKSAGALGGKIAGAGGSGHLVLVCEPVKQRAVAEALTDRGWEHVPIVFASGGAAAAETEEDRCGSS